MESANLHQLQQSFAGCFLANQSEGFSTIHEPNSSLNWNGNDYCRYLNESSNPSTRDFWPKNENLIPSANTSVIGHEFGFYDTRNFIPESTNEFQLGKLEEGMSGCLSKSNEMNHSLFNASYIKNENQNLLGVDQNIWLNSFSYGSGELYSNAQKSSRLASVDPHAGLTFNHVPITNVANMDVSSAEVSSSLGLKKTMDLVDYAQHGESCRKSSGGSMPFHYGHHMHESSDSPSHSSNKMTSALKKEVLGRKKFNCNSPEMKPSHRTAKKPRAVLSQSSSPALKVRKEKLGDRIAALHILVAPFGKTDTASVLTEAIGYIQFLQDQIQTLSMPYMNSARNNQCRTVQAGSRIDERKGEHKTNLRSRGLCLVPSSFTSFVSSLDGGISWKCLLLANDEHCSSV